MKTFGETLNIAPIDAKMMSQPADTEEGRIEQNELQLRCSGQNSSKLDNVRIQIITLDDFHKMQR